MSWLLERGIPYKSDAVTTAETGDGLTPQEMQALGLVVTNLDKPVFAFREVMPSAIVAMLFARYSRSPNPLRVVAAREFLDKKIQDPKPGTDLFDREAIAALGDRITVEFGDDSVLQAGSVYVACEMVSQLAVKALEDSRFFAGIEKSSRYVVLSKKVDGEYLYFRPPEVLQSELGGEYLTLMNEAFDLYKAAYTDVREYVTNKFPQAEGVDDKVYKAAIKSKTLDIVRVFLPMATLTNVGMSMSGQSMELILNKLQASKLQECRWLGEEIYNEVDQVAHAFVKRVGEDKYGGKVRGYMTKSEAETAKVAGKLLPKEGNREVEASVKLAWRSNDNLDRVLTEILFPHAKGSWDEVNTLVQNLGRSEKQQLVAAYLAGREDRRHKPGRAFEVAQYTFEVVDTAAVWRDLQRHRILTQQRQLLTTELGFKTPQEFFEIEHEGSSWAEIYKQHMEKRNELHKKVAEKVSPEAAQYVVGFGNYLRFDMTANLRELYHLIPLRAGAAGHPDYRRIAREMFYQALDEDAMLVEPMARFVDTSDEPRLERLQQLQRVKEKMDRLGSEGGDTFLAD